MTWRILFGVELALAVIAALISYFYWGYVVRPPGIPSTAREASAVHAMTSLSDTLARDGHWKESLKSISYYDNTGLLRTIKYWNAKSLISVEIPELDPAVAARIAWVILRRFPAGTHKDDARFFIASFTHPSLGPLYLVVGTSQLAKDYFFRIEGVVRQNNDELALIEESSYYHSVEGIFLGGFFCLLNILILGMAAACGIWVGLVYVAMRVYPSAKILVISIRSKLSEPRSLIVISVTVLWLIAWFCPIKAGRCGEAEVMKMGFAVYEWDGLDETNYIDCMRMLFSWDQVGVSVDGTAAVRKIGGVPEYFGVKEARCSFLGRPPTSRD